MYKTDTNRVGIRFIKQIETVLVLGVYMLTIVDTISVLYYLTVQKHLILVTTTDFGDDFIIKSLVNRSKVGIVEFGCIYILVARIALSN